MATALGLVPHILGLLPQVLNDSSAEVVLTAVHHQEILGTSTLSRRVEVCYTSSRTLFVQDLWYPVVAISDHRRRLRRIIYLLVQCRSMRNSIKVLVRDLTDILVGTICSRQFYFLFYITIIFDLILLCVNDHDLRRSLLFLWLVILLH